MADNNNGTAVSSTPYGVFATFMTAVGQLAQGVPNQIDRSVFPGMAWTAQTQLLSALRSLRLMSEDGKPTPRLHALAVTDEDKRKKALEQIVREHYAEIFELDLMKTTPAELDQRMTEAFDITGDTRKKAVRFFLAALDHLSIEVSPLFGKPRSRKRTGNGPARRTRRRRTPASTSNQSPAQPDQGGTSRTIELRSGGTLTLSVSLDLLRVSSDDRTFVIGLVDKLDEYERSDAPNEKGNEA